MRDCARAPIIIYYYPGSHYHCRWYPSLQYACTPLLCYLVVHRSYNSYVVQYYVSLRFWLRKLRSFLADGVKVCKGPVLLSTNVSSTGLTCLPVTFPGGTLSNESNNQASLWSAGFACILCRGSCFLVVLSFSQHLLLNFMIQKNTACLRCWDFNSSTKLRSNSILWLMRVANHSPKANTVDQLNVCNC